MSRCKYYKQIEQVSYDRGETWEDVYPEQTRKGELYEEDSDDCEPYQRWTLVPGGYICEEGSKYEKKVLEVSDDGVTYRIKYPDEYMKGDLIEEDSVECNFKWYGHYYNINGGGHYPYDPGTLRDPIKIVLCYNSSSVLTNDDITYSSLSSESGYTPYSGYIGNCVTNISAGAFFNCDSLSSVIIPDSVTSIGNYAFQTCGVLRDVTIGSGITSIGENAFNQCYQLRSITIYATTPPTIMYSNIFETNCPIYVPSDSVDIYKSEWGWAGYASRIQPIPTS